MQRRLVIMGGLAGVLPLGSWAHHGWGGFDTSRPIYLEGQVAKVMWGNPHTELQIDVAPDLKVPPDLASRSVPAQQQSVNTRELLGKAVAPTRKDKRWTVELAPLTRMNAWKVPEPKVGDKLSLLGYTFEGEKGEPVARAEVLFIAGQAYPLRSGPA